MTYTITVHLLDAAPITLTAAAEPSIKGRCSYIAQYGVWVGGTLYPPSQIRKITYHREVANG